MSLKCNCSTLHQSDDNRVGNYRKYWQVGGAIEGNKESLDHLVRVDGDNEIEIKSAWRIWSDWMNCNCCTWQGKQTWNQVRILISCTFQNVVCLDTTLASINCSILWIAINGISPFSKVYDAILVCHALNWRNMFSNWQWIYTRIS